MSASITNLTIGGIPIQVVGLDELRNQEKERPVGVLFLLHGRLGELSTVKSVISPLLNP